MYGMCACVCFLVKVDAGKECFSGLNVWLLFEVLRIVRKEKNDLTLVGLFDSFEVHRTLLQFCPGLIPVTKA